MLTDHLFDIFIGILQPTIKKLVTVTEMLSKHKQKYMEMIRWWSILNNRKKENMERNDVFLMFSSVQQFIEERMVIKFLTKEI